MHRFLFIRALSRFVYDEGLFGAEQVYNLASLVI